MEEPTVSAPPPVPGKGKDGDVSKLNGKKDAGNGTRGKEGRDSQQQGVRIGDTTVIGEDEREPSNDASRTKPEDSMRTNSIRRFLSRKALNTTFVAGGGHNAHGAANGQAQNNGINGHKQAMGDDGKVAKGDLHLRPDSPASFFSGRTALSRIGSARGDAGEKWYRRFSTGAVRKRAGGGLEDSSKESADLGQAAGAGVGAGIAAVGQGEGEGRNANVTVPRKPVSTGPPPPRLPELSTLREDESMGEDMFRDIK